MKTIIVGTNRPQSNSRKIANVIIEIYKKMGESNIEIIDLAELPLNELNGSKYGLSTNSTAIDNAISKIKSSEGLIMIVPEYNGSMPGALKYFIDFWPYPAAFEKRPVAFVGLGGMFGGLRPIEHLQQVFGYRNSYIFPERIFLMNVWKMITNDQINEPSALERLTKQAQGFSKFCRALANEKLDANSIQAET